jgi:hypothetical protein
MYESCCMGLVTGIYNLGVAGCLFIWFWLGLSYFLSNLFG